MERLAGARSISVRNRFVVINQVAASTVLLPEQNLVLESFEETPLRTASDCEILLLLTFCCSVEYLLSVQSFIVGRRILLFKLSVRVLFRLLSIMSYQPVSENELFLWHGTTTFQLEKKGWKTSENYIRYFHSFPHLYRRDLFSVYYTLCSTFASVISVLSPNEWSDAVHRCHGRRAEIDDQQEENQRKRISTYRSIDSASAEEMTIELQIQDPDSTVVCSTSIRQPSSEERKTKLTCRWKKRTVNLIHFSVDKSKDERLEMVRWEKEVLPRPPGHRKHGFVLIHTLCRD